MLHPAGWKPGLWAKHSRPPLDQPEKQKFLVGFVHLEFINISLQSPSLDQVRLFGETGGVVSFAAQKAGVNETHSLIP